MEYKPSPQKKNIILPNANMCLEFFWYTTLNVSVGGRDQPLGAIGQITDTP